MTAIGTAVQERVHDHLPLGADARYEIVRKVTLEDGRSPLEGLAEIVVSLSLANRALEALEASIELEEFLRDFRHDLVDELRHQTPPQSWTEIAAALGVSKQAARERYGVAEDSPRRGSRPGPQSDRQRSFFFDVNKSFLSGSSPITIPTELNEWVAERLLEDRKGASKAIMIEGLNKTSLVGRLRYSVTGGHGYYQLNAPRGVLGLRFGERIEVILVVEDAFARVRIRKLHPTSG